jgi:hypothetical protein
MPRESMPLTRIAVNDRVGLARERRLNPHFSHWIGGSGKVGLKAASGSDFLT